MKSRDRLALLSLILAISVHFGTAARAESLSAQSGRIIQLERAGKYAQALPLAQAMVTALDKEPPNRDLAGALNNLAQIYGGMGLMDDLPLARFWRDARVERIWDGTSEIQRHIISRDLLRPLGA